MKRLRDRMAFLFGAGFSVLSLLLCLSLLAFIYMDLRNYEKRELEEVADNIRGHLEEYARNATPGDFADAVTGINERISFAFSEDDLNLGYAIFSEHGRLLYEFYRTPRSPFTDMDPSSTAPGKMHERWTGYKDCVFCQWLPAGPYRIAVCCTHRITYIDRLLHGLLIALCLSVILSVLLGHILGRRISEPLAAIAATAARIEIGELDARIPTLRVDGDTAAAMRALNHTFAELESSFQRISQFSADVAHELKTPLTAMRGALEVALSRSRSVEDCQAVMGQLVEDIADMSRFTDDLLMLSRPGSRKVDDTFGPVCVRNVFVQVCDGLSGAADAKGIRLTFEAPDGLALNGHTHLLTRLVSNLVANAIQFSRVGGSVRIAAHLRRGTVVIEVSDTGIGIAPEHLDRIFGRLYQVDATRGSGHGLGLAIVKWIADMHSATITVESEPDKGATFTVAFPRWPLRSAGDREV